MVLDARISTPRRLASPRRLILLVFGAAVALAAAANASPHSPLVARFESYDIPGAATVHDLNGDQRPDLIGFSDSYLFVQLGTPDHRFSPAILYPIGASPNAFVLEDFDGDALLDAAVACHSSSSLVVLPGQTGGAFGAPTSTPLSSPPDAIAAGDFDEDGVLDLALSSSTSDNATLLRGLGGGAFVFHGVMPMGLGPVAVLLRDFTGDGHVDLFVHDHPSGSASVFPGEGDGAFGSAIVSSPTNGGFSLAFGHLDGDGHLDFVSGGVRPLLGSGTGAFYPMTNRPVPSGAGLAIGDLDGDGSTDVATAQPGIAEYIYSDHASVLLGRGDGTFEAGYLDLGVSPYPVHVAIADLTGDQVPDLAVSHHTYAYSVKTLAVLPGGADFGIETEFSVSDAPQAVRIADFDGDGIPDLATTHTPINGSGSPLASQVIVHHGFGNGVFGSGPLLPVGSRPYELAVGDLNGDGRLDLVTANYGDHTATILLRTAAGSYTRSDVALGGRPTDLELVDVDGDGALDLLVAAESLGMLRLLGNGNGTFGAVVSLGFGHPVSTFASGDFDGDGDPDLAMAHYSGSTLVVRLGDGAGGFGPRTDFALCSSAGELVLGHLDPDADLDLAVACVASRTVTLLRGTGTGGFEGRTEHSVGASTGNSVAIADIDVDGWGDVVASRGGNTNTLALWLSDGSGGFEERVDLGAGTTPQRAAAGDLDLDGRPDLVATCWKDFFSMNDYRHHMLGNEITVLLNRPGTSVDVEEPVSAHQGLVLERVAPNPSPGALSIEYVLPTAARARLAVLDAQGREVASFEGASTAGRHHARWDGRGSSGAVPPGVYFLRVEAGGRLATRRFALVR